MAENINLETIYGSLEKDQSLKDAFNLFRSLIFIKLFGDNFHYDHSIDSDFILYKDVVYTETVYGTFCKTYNPNAAEKILLLTALSPSIHPELLDQLLRAEEKLTISKSRIGGFMKEPSRAFLPTCRTALFLLDSKFHGPLHEYFSNQHYLFKEGILKTGIPVENIPSIDLPLLLSEETYCMYTQGNYHPRMSSTFPATLLETENEWSDLVIGQDTLKRIDEIKAWLQYEDQILQTQGVRKWLKPGYRALFYGPSGTGKSLTASLLGKTFNRPVYRTDLSLMVSKYIGETEKNMEMLFNTAESKNWILFFDEAESLFGKRSSVSDSNDRYANQEISYLLQRVEGYNGMVILASNKLFDIDEAFKRRFQNLIEFPEPGVNERIQLWKNMFDGLGYKLAEDIKLETIAENHRITGGLLINVLRYCSLKASVRGTIEFTWQDIEEGMKKEYSKMGWAWQDKPLKKSEQKIKIMVQS